VQHDVCSFEHSLQGESISVLADVVLHINGIGDVEHHGVAVLFAGIFALIAIFIQKSEQQLAKVSLVCDILHEYDDHKEECETPDPLLDWVIHLVAVGKLLNHEEQGLNFGEHV